MSILETLWRVVAGVKSHVGSGLAGAFGSAAEVDAEAARDLLPLVYHELRRLALTRLREVPPGQTLQATALVQEAYLIESGSLIFAKGCDGRRSRTAAPGKVWRNSHSGRIRLFHGSEGSMRPSRSAEGSVVTIPKRTRLHVDSGERSRRKF